MNLSNAIKTGINGADTISLFQDAIDKMKPKLPGTNILRATTLLQKVKKKTKKGGDPTKLYIKLANEILSGVATYGLTAVAKKKNTILRGGLLGLAAGLGHIFFTQENENDEADDISRQIMTVALYTSGGLIAGGAARNWIKKKKKKNKKKK